MKKFKFVTELNDENQQKTNNSQTKQPIFEFATELNPPGTTPVKIPDPTPQEQAAKWNSIVAPGLKPKYDFTKDTMPIVAKSNPTNVSDLANNSKDGLTLDSLMSSGVPTWQKVLSSPLALIGSANKAAVNSPLGSRFIGSSGGITMDKGTPIQPVGSAGKIGNFLATQAGGLANLKLQGGDTNLFAGGNMITNALPQASKIAQYGANAIGQGANLGYYSALDTGFKGGSNTDILKSAGTGALMGAGFGVLGKGITDLAPKISSKLKGPNDFEQSKPFNGFKVPEDPINIGEQSKQPTQNVDPLKMQAGQTFNLTTNKIESPLKTTPKINNPNGVLKPKFENLNTDTLPLQNRTIENVGDKKVNAYQFDHPELKPYISQEANVLKGELERTTKAEKLYGNNADGNNTVTSTRRQTTQDVASLIDLPGSSYLKVSKAIDDVIADHGRENNALAKRVELVVDNRLSNGYHDDVLGQKIPPHNGYIEDKNFIQSMPDKLNTSTIKKSDLNSLQSKLPTTDTNTPTTQPIQSSNAITPKELLSTDYSKVTDENTLVNHVNEIQKQMKNIMPQLDLQQFSRKLEEAKTQLNEVRKTSQFRTNTLDRTTALTDSQKAQIDPKEFDYVTQSSKEWQANAEKAVDTNIHQVMNKIENQTALSGGEDAHRAAIVAMRLKEQGATTGDYHPLVNWLKTVSSKTRETARALKGTDTAWEKKSADGAIMDTARVVDSAEETVKKTDPKKIEKIDNQTNTAVNSLDSIDKEVASSLDSNGQYNFLDMAPKFETKDPLINESLKPLSAAEKLATKIDNRTAPKQETIPGFDKMGKDEQTMINTLFNIAKEQLPKQEKGIGTTPEELISAALKNKNEYQNVWNGAKTILKDKFKFDDDRINTLSDLLEKKLRPVFEEKKLNKAIQMQLKEKGINLTDIVKQHYSVNSATRKDLTETLINKTGLSGEDADYLAKFINNRMKDLTKQKKESVLNQMFKEKSKPVQKNLIEKVQELINLGAYDRQSVRDLIKQKEGLPILKTKDIKFITEHMDKSKTFEDGSYAQKKELALVREVIENKIPKTKMGKFNNLQTLGMLSSPKTAIRNTVSNGIFRGVTDLKNTVRTAIDTPISMITKERTSTLPNLKAEGQGLKTGIKETLLDFKNNVDTRKSDKMELTNNQWNKNGNVLNKIASNANRYERMMLSDRPFEGAAFADEMARQKKLSAKNGTTFDPIKATEQAKKEAAYATFQDDTYFSKLALEFKRKLNNGKEWGIGDAIIKFAKTPANIASRVIDYTPPVALARALKAGISKQGFNQSVFVDQLAKTVTGAGITGIGYGLSKMGVITTGGSTNYNLNALKTKTGLGNFTINISGINRVLNGGSPNTEKGDLMTSYDWASPTSVLLTLGANLAKSKTGVQAGSDALEGLTSGFNSLVDQPMTQGLQSLFGSHDVGKAMMTLGASIPQTLIPSIVNNFRQLDNSQKETYDPNILKQSLNQATNRIPGLNNLLPNKSDIMGDNKKVMQKNGLTNIFLNPATTTRYTPDKSSENALNLYKSSDENGGILPKLVDKTISGTKLTARQYTDYQQDLGSRISNIYKNNPSEKEANSLILKAGKEAKATLFKKLDLPKKK